MAVAKKSKNRWTEFWQDFDFYKFQLRLKQAGLILVVLLISWWLGMLGRDVDYVLIGIGMVMVIPMILFFLFMAEHLDWGLLLLIFTAVYTPLSLPTGTSSRIVDSMVVTLLFLGLWVLRMVVVEKRIHIASTPINLPLLGFAGVTALALVWSMLFRDPQVQIWDSFPLVQVASTVMMIALAGAFFLVANFGARPIVLKVIVWVFLLGSVIGLVGNFLGRTLVNNFGLFSMWSIALALSMAFFSKKIGWFLRLLLLGLVAGWVVWGFVMHISWVAGWLPGMLVIGLLALMRDRRLAVLIGVGMIILGLVFSSYFVDRIQLERDESGDTRIAAWQVNWRVTSEHLLFGTGPGGYTAYYMTYFPYEGMATHNNYLDVLAQTGLIGFILWIWFFGAVVWQGHTLVRRLRGRGDFFEAAANAAFAGSIGCVVIMGFGDWLLPFAYTQSIAGFDYAVYSWIFMGFIVAIDRLVPKKVEAEHA